MLGETVPLVQLPSLRIGHEADERVPGRGPTDPFQQRIHHQRTETAAFAEWQQACRQRWRALALVIKAKLEAVETGIATFEQEFLAYIVLPNGQSVGDTAIPAIEAAAAGKDLPPLLGNF